MRILFVHGINQDPGEPFDKLWVDELRGAGLPCEGVGARWPSTGSFIGDVIKFMTPTFKADADEAVCHALLDFARAGGGVVLSHSMGTVLAINAERLVRTGLQMVCLASPLSNPAVLQALLAIGYGREPAEPIIHLWNDDDPIPGGKHAQQPSYFKASRIAVASNEAKAFASEHDVRAYLRHQHTVNALRVVASRSITS